MGFDNPASDVTYEKNCIGTNLLDLPPEILLRIFSNLDMRTLFEQVVLVCKAFYEVLTEEGIWKTIFPLKWGESVNLVDDLNYITDWRSLYRTYDNIETCWKSKENHLLLRTLHGHYAPVDSVHVMAQGNLCVTGARDRTAVVWDISEFRNCRDKTEIENIECPKKATLGEHKGWVWTINSDDRHPNEVVTGSWDSKLRVWDLNDDCSMKNCFKYHPAAVLCLRANDGLYYSGCYDKRVRMFDPRANEVVQEFTCHKRPVLSLELYQNLILSGSEDKTIGIYDQRICKYLSNIHVDCAVMCLSLSHDLGYSYLRAGGAAGSLYTFDATDGKFTFLNLTSLWSKYKVTRLCNFHGALIACSQSGNIHPYTSGRNVRPLPMALPYSAHNGDIADAHAKSGILATASSDDSVAIWKFQDL